MPPCLVIMSPHLCVTDTSHPTVWVHRCSHPQGFTWRLRVDVRCLPQSPLHLIFWGRISHWDLLFSWVVLGLELGLSLHSEHLTCWALSQPPEFYTVGKTTDNNTYAVYWSFETTSHSVFLLDIGNKYSEGSQFYVGFKTPVKPDLVSWFYILTHAVLSYLREGITFHWHVLIYQPRKLLPISQKVHLKHDSFRVVPRCIARCSPSLWWKGCHPALCYTVLSYVPPFIMLNWDPFVCASSFPQLTRVTYGKKSCFLLLSTMASMGYVRIQKMLESDSPSKLAVQTLLTPCPG